MTKSYELLREGELSVDGRLIEVGATTWPTDGVVPILERKDGGGTEVCGRLTNLRREGNSIFADADVDAPALTVGGKTLDSWKSVLRDLSVGDFCVQYAMVSEKEEFPWVMNDD